MGRRACWLPTWRAACAAVFSAAGMAAAFPPLDWWPLALVGLVPLLLLAWRLRPIQAFFAGWLFGLTLSGALMYWLWVALTVYGGMPPYLAAAALAMLLLYLGLYPAAWAWLASLSGRGGPGWWWLAPLAWAGLEWLRGWLFTGLPWLPLAGGVSGALPLVQTAELWGAAGVGLAVAAVNALLARAAWPLVMGRRPAARELACLALALVLTAAGWWWGAGRMREVRAAAEAAPKLTVTVVQANVPLKEMWRPERRAQVIASHAELTRLAAADSPRRPWLVVWPESAAPFYLMLDARPSQPVVDLAREMDAYLAVGSLGAVPKPETGKLATSNRVWLLGPRGTALDHYDKVHLVPFGEYTPLPSIFFWIGAVAQVGSDFAMGTEGKNLDAGGASVAPLICYESIFGELARAQRARGARLMINQTNDAWYGKTGAAAQHMRHLVLRAVENRVAIARAANTGISCFVMPDGGVVQATGLFVPAVETRALPLLWMSTFYTRHGDWLGPLGFLAVAVIPLAAWLVRRRRREA